jgi:putative protease
MQPPVAVVPQVAQNQAQVPQKPLLLAPAGDWECARAAVENGADAIYFGLDRFNARMRAQNFTQTDLPELMAWLHRRGVKGYVTFNTLVFSAELGEAEQYLRVLIETGVDAAIVQDLGMVRLLRHLSPDFPIHASTQMTLTSGAGIRFAQELGCDLAVLARECSIPEIHKIQAELKQEQGSPLPLEVFVHGALCVAYSGQCLTSEALGGRSANRGECAQACRMTYDLMADGKYVDLGDRQYLLSPQDLAGVDLIPALIEAGITCFKIEGRLKSPDYVAGVTQVYRRAIDRAWAGSSDPSSAQERYQLEMSFSRGLYTGWLEGIDNQALVHGRYGKKRGVYLGQVTQVWDQKVEIGSHVAIKAGDGILIETASGEEGGRVFQVQSVRGKVRLSFGNGSLRLDRIRVGDQVWKTSDPALEKALRQSYAGDQPHCSRPLEMVVSGQAGMPLQLVAQDQQGHQVKVSSQMPLEKAEKKPLTPEKLAQQLGRLGNTGFELGSLRSDLIGDVILPVSELNRLRRQAVEHLDHLRSQPKVYQRRVGATYTDLLPKSCINPQSLDPQLIPLIRDPAQLKAVLESNLGIDTIYCEYEDPRRYREAIQQVKAKDPSVELWVAPPRITKPGEQWILTQVKSCDADGYLVRNYDHLAFFADQRCIGDFSLNVANPITAHLFQSRYGLERLTASYDLNVAQLEDLLKLSPPQWYDITIHQHMPLFHMEHCVFCAFLSTGTDYTNCGRPCEKHEVTLRDRVGSEHTLKADAGCRNTLFNSKAQTGAEYLDRLIDRGARHFRVEFVTETPEQVQQTLAAYQQLLRKEISGSQLWRELKLLNQLGVTRGQLNG